MKLIKLQSKHEQRCDVNVLGLSLTIRLKKRIKTMFKSLFKDPVFTTPKWGFTLTTGSSWRFHNSRQQRCAGWLKAIWNRIVREWNNICWDWWRMINRIRARCTNCGDQTITYYVTVSIYRTRQNSPTSQYVLLNKLSNIEPPPRRCTTAKYVRLYIRKTDISPMYNGEVGASVYKKD